MFDIDDNYGKMPDEDEIIDGVNDTEEEEISFYKPDVVYGDDEEDEKFEPYRAEPVNYNTNVDYREETIVADYDMEPNYEQDLDIHNTNFGKSTVNNILSSQKFKNPSNGLRKNRNGLFDMPNPGQKGFTGIMIVSVVIALIGLVICYFAFRI